MEPATNYPHALATDPRSELPIPGPTSGPKPTASVEPLVRHLNEYKLETEFLGGGCVVQNTCDWKPLSSSRTWKTSKWRDVREIGSGGFGVVRLQERVQDAVSGKAPEGSCGIKLRAVKSIPRCSSLDAGRSQELLALLKLNQNNHLFVKFLGWYENQHNTFLAMEYIKHGDLSKYSTVLWKPTERKEIIKQILEGLEVLHEKEICHRDLKPQNILVACLNPVWIKIADFGGSKRVKNTAARTQIGTVGYTAPEVLGLVPREFKHGFVPYALDIWSLGSMVHELLTSHIPFLAAPCAMGSESGLGDEFLPEQELDFRSLDDYCHGRTEFPANALQESQLDVEAIDFVMRLMNANPNDRLTAASALQHPWLASTYANDYTQRLNSEFWCHVLTERPEILRELSGPAQAQVSHLVLNRAVTCDRLAKARLPGPPNCGPESIGRLTRGNLFQMAAKTTQFDIVKIIAEQKIETGVRNKTILQLVVEFGDSDTINLFLENKFESVSNQLLLLAIEAGNINIIRLFIGRTVDIDLTSVDSEKALRAAAEGGHTDILEFLWAYRRDSNLSALGANGPTPSDIAADGEPIGLKVLSPGAYPIVEYVGLLVFSSDDFDILAEKPDENEPQKGEVSGSLQAYSRRR